MGLCLDGKGRMSVEVRRESFTIHPSYGHEDDGHSDSDTFGKDWRNNPHPEFLLEDLDDLIAALQEAKAYVKDQRSPQK